MFSKMEYKMGHSDQCRKNSDTSDDDQSFPLNLRQQLKEEASLYRRRLDVYKQAQMDQATLINKLQAKVLQYKQRCADLETRLMGQNELCDLTTSKAKSYPKDQSSDPKSLNYEQYRILLDEKKHNEITDVKTALKYLDAEMNQRKHVEEMNITLRNQMHETHTLNQLLTSDLQKLTSEWELLRREMVFKEEEWKEEEQVFNEYYNSEHNKLLHLWKCVLSTKRNFIEMRSTVEHDINAIKTDFLISIKDMLAACTQVQRFFLSENAQSREDENRDKREICNLKDQLESSKTLQEKSLIEIKEKHEDIQTLCKDVEQLEKRCSISDDALSERKQDIKVLEGALIKIYEMVLESEKGTEMVLAGYKCAQINAPFSLVIHRSTEIASFDGLSSSALSETIVSLLHASLHKLQISIHELQVKLKCNEEQLMLVRKQLEGCNETSSVCEEKLNAALAEIEYLQEECSNLNTVKHNLDRSVEKFKTEAKYLEKQHEEMSVVMDNLNIDNEKIQKTNQNLHQQIENLTNERLFLQSDICKLNEELQDKQKRLINEEERCSKLKNDLFIVTEELHELHLQYELLHQEKFEINKRVHDLESKKDEMTTKIDEIMNEKVLLEDDLSRKEDLIIGLNQEHKKLQVNFANVEEGKAVLFRQSNDYCNDINALKRELLQDEQQKLEFESEKLIATEKINMLNMEKGKLEMELAQIIRERNELNNQFSLSKHANNDQNEELMRTRQKLEQSTETNSRLNRNLENLLKDFEQMQNNWCISQKDINTLQEQNHVYKVEKESIETMLFDGQKSLEALKVKKQSLDRELNSSTQREQQLKVQVERLTNDLHNSECECVKTKEMLMQQLHLKESECVQKISQIQSQNDENRRKLMNESEIIQNDLEKTMQGSLKRLENEKNCQIDSLTNKINSLQTEIESLSKQHEDEILRMENDKQQELMIICHDQQALQERYDALKSNFENEQDNFHRCKRDQMNRSENDRMCIKDLKEKLTTYKSKLEDNKVCTEEENMKLQTCFNELQIQNDSLQTEVEKYTIQLNLNEEKRTSLSSELNEALQKLKEVENNAEKLQAELADTKRILNIAIAEKEKYYLTNQNLRLHIKKAESEKQEFGRQIDDDLNKLNVLEISNRKFESERNQFLIQIREQSRSLQELQQKILHTEDELHKRDVIHEKHISEEKELQARLLNEIDERERAIQEVQNLKKQKLELNRNLEQTREDLIRCRSHEGNLKEEWHGKEQNLLEYIQDNKTREKLCEDQKHNLEICLSDATQQLRELKTRLIASEERIRVLNEQLSEVDKDKRDVEHMLSSIIVTLKRTAGIQMDGTVKVPYATLKNMRGWSPARGLEERIIEGHVEIEKIRKGIRNLMQQFMQIERERDEQKLQVVIIKNQLKEADANLSKSDGRLNKVLKTVKDLQDEKCSLETELNEKRLELESQTILLRTKVEENQSSYEKNVNLKLKNKSLEDERLQCEEKLLKVRLLVDQLDEEKKGLQRNIQQAESKITNFEVQRIAIHGDLQRMQMHLQEKDSALEKIQQNCEIQSKNIQILEEKCSKYKQTMDKMNTCLEKYSCNESGLREEVKNLQILLAEAGTKEQFESQKLKQIQKQITSTEAERQMMQEKLQHNYQKLSDLKRTNQQLQEEVTRLNNNLANKEIERSNLESRLHLAHWLPLNQNDIPPDWDGQLQFLLQERSALQDKVNMLHKKVQLLESNKRAQENYGLESEQKVRSSKSIDKCGRDREDYRSLQSYPSELRADTYQFENRIVELEFLLNEKDLEINRLRDLNLTAPNADVLSNTREFTYKQQITRLENEIKYLRQRLRKETARFQEYFHRTNETDKELEELRQALGNSLKTVAQDPALDALLLEHETRKLDNTLASTFYPTGSAYKD